MNDNNSNLSSKELASLICDALKDANIISNEHLTKAIEISTTEIDVRKSLKDYWCSCCPCAKD